MKKIFNLFKKTSFSFAFCLFFFLIYMIPPVKAEEQINEPISAETILLESGFSSNLVSDPSLLNEGKKIKGENPIELGGFSTIEEIQAEKTLYYYNQSACIVANGFSSYCYYFNEIIETQEIPTDYFSVLRKNQNRLVIKTSSPTIKIRDDFFVTPTNVLSANYCLSESTEVIENLNSNFTYNWKTSQKIISSNYTDKGFFLDVNDPTIPAKVIFKPNEIHFGNTTGSQPSGTIDYYYVEIEYIPNYISCQGTNSLSLTDSNILHNAITYSNNYYNVSETYVNYPINIEKTSVNNALTTSNSYEISLFDNDPLKINLLLEFPKFNINNDSQYIIEQISKPDYNKAYLIYSSSFNENEEGIISCINSSNNFCKVKSIDNYNNFNVYSELDPEKKIFISFIITHLPTSKPIRAYYNSGSEFYTYNKEKISGTSLIINNNIFEVNKLNIFFESYGKELCVINKIGTTIYEKVYDFGTTSTNESSNFPLIEGKYYIYYINHLGEISSQYLEIDNTAISYNSEDPLCAKRSIEEELKFGIFDSNFNFTISNETKIIMNLNELPSMLFLGDKIFTPDKIQIIEDNVESKLISIKLGSEFLNGKDYELKIIDDVFNVNFTYTIKINNNIEDNFVIKTINEEEVINNTSSKKDIVLEALNGFVYINNEKIESNTYKIFSEERKHNLTIIDFYGSSCLYNFEIDKTAPNNYLDDKNVYLDEWYITYDENLKYYSFSSEARAKAFAKYREEQYNYERILANLSSTTYSTKFGQITINLSLLKSDNYFYVYCDKNINPYIEIFYDSQEKDNYINTVVISSITHLYNIEENYQKKYQAGFLVENGQIIGTDDLYIEDNRNIKLFYTNKKNITFSQLLNEEFTIQYSTNGETYSSVVLEELGLKVYDFTVNNEIYIKLIDKAENYTEYKIVFDLSNMILVKKINFDNQIKNINYSSATNNLTKYLLAKELSIYSNDPNDSPYIFKIKNSTGIYYVKNNSLFFTNESVYYNGEDIYEISLYDLALNCTKKLILYYINTQTEVNIIENETIIHHEATEENEEYDEIRIESFSFNCNYKRINSELEPKIRKIEYQETLTSPKTILFDNLSISSLHSLTFTNYGFYSIIIDDVLYELSNISLPKEYELKQNKPIGKILIYNISSGNYDLDKTIEAENEICKTTESFTFTWISSYYTCTYLFNNKLYNFTKGYKLTDEGTYQMILSIGTGDNITQTLYNIIIDKTAPKGIITSYTKNNEVILSNTGFNVKISTLENCNTVKLLFNTVVNGIEEQKYELFNLTKETASDYYSFTFDDSTYSFINSSYTIKNNDFSFVLYDELYNSNKYVFSIDKKSPSLSIQIRGESYTENKITANNFSFIYGMEVKWFELMYVDFNNNERRIDIYSSNSSLKSEGTYRMTVKDLYGNETSLCVILDKSNPSFKLYDIATNEEIISTIKKTKNDIQIVFDDNIYCVVSYKYNDNGIEKENSFVVENNFILSDSFVYSISSTFKEFNEAVLTRIIEIDKTAPVAQLYKEEISTKNKVDNGCKSNKNMFLVCKELDIKCYLVLDEILKELEFDPYTKSIVFKDDGNYVIKLNDQLGNESFYNFSINKIKPIAQLYKNEIKEENKIENGATINSAVLISFPLNCFAYYESSNERTWITSEVSLFSEEKEWQIILLDDYGNTNLYNFIICYDLPDGCFYSYKTNLPIEYKEHLIINYDFYFKFSKQTCLINGEVYTSATRITDEGTYEFILTNIYGTTKNYYIELDKSLPSIKFYTSNSYNQEIENFVFNDIVYWKIENNCTINSINGEIYTKNSVSGSIQEEQLYSFAISDNAGNSNIISFEIDKTAPELTIYKKFIDEEQQIENLEIGSTVYFNEPAYLLRKEKNAILLVNGEVKTFTSNSYFLSEEGFYEIKILDKANNSNSYFLSISYDLPDGILSIANNSSTNQSVSFNYNENYTANLNNFLYLSGSEITDEGTYEIILTNIYGTSCLYNFEIDKTAPELNFNMEFKEFINKNVSFEMAKKGETVYLDNELFDKTIITQEGAHVLKIIDKAGNYNEYTFEIKKTFNEELCSVIKNKENYTISIKKDSSLTLTINDIEYFDDEIILSEEGNYQLVFKDKYGNEIESFVSLKLPIEKNNTIKNILTIVLIIGSSAVILLGVTSFIKARIRKPKLF